MSEQERDQVADLNDGADNSNAIQENSAKTKPKKQLDNGAKRNLIIIGAAFGLAALAMAAIFVMGQDQGKDGLPSTVINPGVGGLASRAPSGPLTEDEVERLNRVTQRQADEAKEQGKVFIPSEVPSEVASTPSALASAAPPPGSNYALSGYAGGGGSASQHDAERMQRIMQGMQAQMARIVQAHMPPATSSAERYRVESQQAQPSAQPASAVAQAAQTGPSGSSGPQPVEIVPSLTLVAAELLSPIDTDKTAFVSAKIASGPMAGGTLYGAAEMVRDQGVRVRFNRMLAPNGRSYTINAIAIDAAEAHDLLSANIDRKLFERYVLPFIGAVAGGYLDAIAQPSQQVTIADGGTVVVQQPEVKAKQAAARGLAAGVNQAVAEASKTRGTPSASLPAGTPIGVLFLDAVQSSSVTQGASSVANWAPGLKTSTQ